MDLTSAGEEVLRNMMKEHGAVKGETMFKDMIDSGAKEAQDWVKKNKKSQTILGDRNMNNTAAGIRKIQGPGMWQADIGE